eukprot:COSAG03_NODE_3863_length_1788_cov_0.979278_1_plen_166_part_10
MVGIVSTRVQQLNVRTVTKTLDNVTVSLQIAVQYRIINDTIKDEPEATGNQIVPFDPEMDRAENNGVWRAFYRLTDIVEQLRPYVEDVVRSEVPKRSLSLSLSLSLSVCVCVCLQVRHHGGRRGRRSTAGASAAGSLGSDGRVCGQHSAEHSEYRKGFHSKPSAAG